MGAFGKTFGDGFAHIGAKLNLLPPDSFNTTDTLASWDFTNLDTITKDVNNLISSIVDELGSGKELLEATELLQPIYVNGGALFTANVLKAAITKLQPFYIYMVFEQITWTANAYIIDGGLSDSIPVIQRNTIAGLTINAGSNSPRNDYMPLNALCVARFFFDGANSKLQINEMPATIGNFGTQHLYGGFTVGRNSEYAVGYSNIFVQQIVIQSINDEANVIPYLKSKHKIQTQFNNAKLLLTFDDGSTTLFTDLYPILQAKSVPATCYLISDSVPTGWDNVRTMYAGGVDFQSHGKTHTNFALMSDAQIVAEIEGTAATFIAQSLPAPLHIAYPYGGINNAVKLSVKPYYLTGRANEGGLNYIYPMPDKLSIPGNDIDNIDAAGLIALKAKIDFAVANKLAIATVSHGVSSTGDVAKVSAAMLEAIIDYAQLNGMDVITVSQLSNLIK